MTQDVHDCTRGASAGLDERNGDGGMALIQSGRRPARSPSPRIESLVGVEPARMLGVDAGASRGSSRLPAGQEPCGLILGLVPEYRCAQVRRADDLYGW